MDTFHRAALLRLVGHQEAPCVSLYMPTHPAGRESAEDEIRLKNLLREAEQQLAGQWQTAAEAEAMLKQPAALPQDADFWQHRDKGLAILVLPGMLEAYRLSYSVPEQVVVARRFRLRRLLPLLEERISFYLLVLSEKQATFYSVDEQSMTELAVPNMPKGMVEALQSVGADRGQQAHSAKRDTRGKQAAVFHGQGGVADSREADQTAYCAEVDNAVGAWLGTSTRPMVLACPQQLAAIYRTRNSYAHLLDATLLGNHDQDQEHVLRQQVWEMAQPLLKTTAATAASNFEKRRQRVSDDAQAIVCWAHEGRIDRLLYDPQAELLGRYHVAEHEVTVTGNESDIDLIDMAAIETLRHGGDIASISGHDEIPTNSPLAATLRF